jgi:hypothetical protein
LKKIKLIRDRSAIETIEASYTIPIALMMMIAIINLGMVVFGQQAVEQAARQGARMGSVAQSSAAYYASSSAQKAIEASAIIQDPVVKILSASGAPGSILKVRVSGNIPNFFGGLVPGLPRTFVVTGNANFRQEGWQ